MFALASKHPAVWTDINRMITLNSSSAAAMSRCTCARCRSRSWTADRAVLDARRARVRPVRRHRHRPSRAVAAAEAPGSSLTRPTTATPSATERAGGEDRDPTLFDPLAPPRAPNDLRGLRLWCDAPPAARQLTAHVGVLVADEPPPGAAGTATVCDRRGWLAGPGRRRLVPDWLAALLLASACGRSPAGHRTPVPPWTMPETGGCGRALCGPDLGGGLDRRHCRLVAGVAGWPTATSGTPSARRSRSPAVVGAHVAAPHCLRRR